MGGHGDRLYDNLKSFFLAAYHVSKTHIAPMAEMNPYKIVDIALGGHI